MSDSTTKRVLLPSPRESRPATAVDTPVNQRVLETVKSEWEMFGSLFVQFLMQRTSQPIGEKPIRQQTPRSEVPLEHFSARPLMAPAFRLRFVHFSCPGCHRPISLARSQAGQKVRCPTCHMALRAPCSRNRHAARCMERDMESILHPEHFPDSLTPAHVRIEQNLRRQAITMAAMAMIFVIAALKGFTKIVFDNVPPVPMAAFPAEQLRENRTRDLVSIRPRAQDLVERFLTASDWRAKAALVRDGWRVGPLMEHYYAEHPEDVSQTWKSISTSGLGFYEGLTNGPSITYVTVVMETDERQVFTVEHDVHGDCIEWESSVGVTAANTGNILRSLGTGNHAVPVLAALDDYYNYDFDDPEKEVCVRLQDPKSNELLSYGYLPRNSDQVQDLLTALEDATPEAPLPLMLEIQGDDKSPATKQMRITRLLQTGWRTSSVVADSN